MLYFYKRTIDKFFKIYTITTKFSRNFAKKIDLTMATDNNEITYEKMGIFGQLRKSLNKISNYPPKVSIFGSKPNVVRLYSPKPLTPAQFNDILIKSYLSNMDENNFTQTFNCEQTSENIAKIVDDDSIPDTTIKEIEEYVDALFKVIQNHALDDKPEVAWNIAENIACFSPDDLQYIHYKEGTSPNLRPYILSRFANINSMQFTLDFISTVEKANQISAGQQYLSMKNAENIYNKLRSYEPNLDEEQKSKIYYLSSELFRRSQIAPGIYHEPAPCSKEILCLRMVLDNAPSPSLVDCCMNRLSCDEKTLKTNAPFLINAYKRLLKSKKCFYPEDKYRFNSQIAKLYLLNANTKGISYNRLDINDISALRWSKHYYHCAYRTAHSVPQKYEALMSISKIHSILNNEQEAKKTALAAAKLLPSPEKYEKTLDIALKDNEAPIALIKSVVQQITKDKISATVKKILFDKALLVTRTKTKDPKVISSVEKLLTNVKLTPNNKIVRNVSTRE